MAISKKNLPLALVTGAGIGIGEATALTLGKLGYRVIVTDILEKEGKAVARKINRSGAADFYYMDVSDTDNVNSVVADVEKKYKKLRKAKERVIAVKIISKLTNLFNSDQKACLSC